MDHAASRTAGRRVPFRGVYIAAALLALVMLAGCATAPGPDANDPFESANRAIFRVNDTFNKNVTLPVAWVYVTYVPGRVRLGVRNMLTNAESPVIFANDLLQGRPARAGQTLARFILNSSFGLGGLVDVGKMNGIAPHQSDFGQTLALYGVPSGPYLVLPLIGPSTPRDIAGTAADFAADPLFYLPPGWPLYVHASVIVGIHTVAPFERHAGAILLRRKLGSSSIDAYATARSLYFEQRARQIEGERPAAPPDAAPN